MVLKNKRLTSKLMCTYFLVVILPSCAVYLFFAATLLERSNQAEKERARYELELAVNELELELRRLENLAQSVLENHYISMFLERRYTADWELMYDYLANVQYQLQSYVNYNQHVEKLYLYSNYRKLNPGGYFLLFDQLPVSIRALQRGSWILGQEETLSYYLGKYGDSAILPEYAVEIRTKELFAEFLGRIERNGLGNVRLVEKEGTIRYIRNMTEMGGSKEEDGQGTYLSLQIPSLELTVETTLNGERTEAESFLFLSLAGLLLFFTLFLLLLFYLRYSLQFARRLVSFTEYIRTMSLEKYEPYREQEGIDEIGELVCAFNGMAEKTNTLVNIVQKNEILRKKAELDAYQSKIEPHFLYGTLESLRMLALEAEDTQVADGLFNLARLMRYSLSSRKDSTIEKELNQVERYLKLQKIRMEERLEWKIWVEEKEILWLPCPQFLLQPVVENSIRHGIEKLRKGGKIEIDIRRQGEGIEIMIEDDGAGITPEAERMVNELIKKVEEDNPLWGEEKGYALFNICMRIRLFYGEKSTLRIKRRMPQGTTCRIWLDMGERKVTYEDPCGG